MSMVVVDRFSNMHTLLLFVRITVLLWLYEPYIVSYSVIMVSLVQLFLTETLGSLVASIKS